MKCLESQIARYRKCSEAICLQVSRQGKILRNKKQSRFQKEKVNEIIRGIYLFRRGVSLKRSPQLR